MTSDDDFLGELRAAALRARASGFTGTAAAIEAIIDAELARRSAVALPPGGKSDRQTNGDDKKR